MNLVESLRILSNTLESLDSDTLLEDKGHLDHPEDLVFLRDMKGAQQALDGIINTSKNPKAITIKWDGYPALIFGRGADGKFSIMDKHMFNKKDGSGRQVYSPEDFKKYDLARGVDRSGLHQLIAEIWPGLEKSTSGAKGYYWGDLLFSQPLEPIDGLYRFKANPNGITYTVDPDSDIGKLMKGKTAGIAVHQEIPPNAPSTDLAVPLNGTIGKLKNNRDVAIIPSKMPLEPNIKIDPKLVNELRSSISKYGNQIHQLMNTAPQARNTFNQLFTTYINRKIINGDLSNLIDDFMGYFESRPMTDSMRAKLSQHLKDNQEGVLGIFKIWIDIYNLKMNVVDQLNKAAEESPVKGYLQSGQQSQEGFVSQGLKFVDRMGFSRQNLSGQR